MRSSLRNLALLGLLALSTAEGRPPHHHGAASIRVPANESDSTPSEDTFYRYRLNSGLGLHVLQASALMVSGQFGYAFFGEMPFYIGPEMSFALFSDGSLFGVWAGGWYERKLSGAPRLSLIVGAAGGPSFTSHVAILPTTSWSAFIDVGAVEELDDLASLRLLLRPGVDGGHFAFLMGLVVSFHFL